MHRKFGGYSWRKKRKQRQLCKTGTLPKSWNESLAQKCQAVLSAPSGVFSVISWFQVTSQTHGIGYTIRTKSPTPNRTQPDIFWASTRHTIHRVSSFELGRLARHLGIGRRYPSGQSTTGRPLAMHGSGTGNSRGTATRHCTNRLR